MPVNKSNPQIKRSGWRQEVREYVLEFIQVIVISLAIIIPVRYFLIQPFYVKGASMEPNFYDHEYLIIDEISYRFRGPGRGEVIVFKRPSFPKEYYIKRIIGLPGERVEVKFGQVIVYNEENPDGAVLDETAYLPENTITTREADVKLGDDEYFVLGDNRQSSLDSRQLGAIKGDSIVGRTWVRGWPIDRITLFEQPAY